MKRPLLALWIAGIIALMGCAPPSTDTRSSDDDEAVAVLDRPTFDAAADSSFIITPGVRVGPVGARTSEAELIAAFGELNVRRETVYLTEGFCTYGTRIFPDTAEELQIAWQDSVRTRIAMVRLQGEGSRWHTGSGVRIGTTLKELEVIAGDVVEFSGFGWDLGGGCEWHEPGAPEQPVGLWLDPDEAFHNSQSPRIEEVYGEQLVRSDHPVIRDGNVLVRKIFLNWGWPYVELDCF